MHEIKLTERTLEGKVAYLQGYLAALKDVEKEIDRLAYMMHGISEMLEIGDEDGKTQNG